MYLIQAKQKKEGNMIDDYIRSDMIFDNTGLNEKITLGSRFAWGNEARSCYQFVRKDKLVSDKIIVL